MDQLLETARERVGQFVNDYDELKLWAEAAVQSATNRVLYGQRHGEPVVFKFFARKARKWQEARALQGLATSGVVPKLYPYPSEEILVMTRLPGRTLWQEQKKLTEAGRSDVYRQVGAGLARLVKYAARPDDSEPWHNPYAPADRFWSTPFDEFFAETLATCRWALDHHQIDQPALHEAVGKLQAVYNQVLAWPSFMHVDDIHRANMLVDEAKFQGFIDFEMSRLGNDSTCWARRSNGPAWTIQPNGPRCVLVMRQSKARLLPVTPWPWSNCLRRSRTGVVLPGTGAVTSSRIGFGRARCGRRFWNNW